MIFSTLLGKIKGVTHGFGTRFDAVPLNGHLLQQVHGKKIIVIRRGEECRGVLQYAPTNEPKADAWITNASSIVLGIKTADCVPILMYDPIQKVVAAVHAGWKGTSFNISGETVKMMREEFYCKPSDIIAAIGPAVGFCCYEVEDDVVSLFKKNYGPNPALVVKGEKKGKYFLNTQGVNRRQLLEGGLLPEKIETIFLCTHCRADLLHSVRRDGDEAGRQVSWVSLIQQ
ncbi:MAG: peptidoglycan editing factor PgeF [Deltaproteobacteria bacterium]|nr:peptidoglycan editing factor PgeF [Deltaproteobacteria bacterium]